MVVAELIVISSGLGGMITVFLARYQMDMAYAITIVFLLISGLLVGLVQYLESRFLKWRSSDESAVRAAM
jgi:ABC-type nitrate/sulfonate/bicarbonate transport system permease component